MTPGHVILGISQTEPCALRAHEHVLVLQYEQWGLFFLPAYALSSVWQVAQGRSGYRNNFFEMQAYAVEVNQALRPNSQLLRTGFGDR